MFHTVSFDLFPGFPIYTRCHFMYTGPNVYEIEQAEKLARIIVTQATLFWLQGNDMALDEEQNLCLLRQKLAEDNDQELLDLISGYQTLSISNDSRRIDSENIIFIQLE